MTLFCHTSIFSRQAASFSGSPANTGRGKIQVPGVKPQNQCCKKGSDHRFLIMNDAPIRAPSDIGVWMAIVMPALSKIPRKSYGTYGNKMPPFNSRRGIRSNELYQAKCCAMINLPVPSGRARCPGYACNHEQYIPEYNGTFYLSRSPPVL